LTQLTRSEVASEFGIQGLPDRESLQGLPLVALGGALNFTGLGEAGFLPNFKISRTNQFVDNLTWIRANHTLKFGADIRYDFTNILGAQNALGNLNFNGRYTGVSLADFLLGWTNQATLSTLAESDMLFRSWMFYAQDDWKVTPTLTLNLGMRYELTTPWFEKQDRMNKILFSPGEDYGRVLYAGERGDGYASRGLVSFDTNNFAPRLGFAWQPAPNWTLRSGAGMFYGGQGSLGASSRMISNHPYTARVQARGTNNSPALLLRDGYAPDFLGDLNAPVRTVADLPPESQTRHWSDDFALPLVYQWNFSVQRQLAGNLGLTVAYVGSSSNNIAYSYDANAAGIGDPDTERERRRLFPEISLFDYNTPAAHGSYHGMDVNLDKRFAAGWSFTAGYTWGHSISQTSEQFVAGDNGGPQDIECFSCEKGNASNDTRHRFVGSTIVDLPFGIGRRYLNSGGVVDAFFGGWQITGLFSIQSGQFFNLTLPNELDRLGTGGVGVWRPNLVGDWRVENPSPDRWFNTGAFAEPCDASGGNCTFGNLGRNTLQEDGLMNLDLGLMKGFRVTERVGLQFRWEVFNVTNHPTYGTPVRDLLSPDVGTIRDTLSTERQMQFALRLNF
ncbi:MAG: TonB-dependent receptor domain-containing protein, partial [Bryobacteraceae bacterium]